MNYSKFTLLKEDFSIYRLLDNDLSEDCDLEAATVMVSREEDITEVESLMGAAGESKKGAGESNKYQLLANMTKVASKVAQKAVDGGKLFKKIIVYGMLIDYNENRARVAQKVFVRRWSYLQETNLNLLRLDVNELFSKLKAVMQANP